MENDRRSKADELIRTLGALGLAQEMLPHSPVVAILTARAEQLNDSFTATNSDR